MCVDLARGLRPLARLPHSLSLVRSGRRAVMANFVYSPERITSVNFGVRSGLPSVLAITALLPKSGVSHCTNKFVQRLAFLCSGATPPHSALVSFISWREVVRFCERDSGAHSALCAFVLPPRSALLSFVSCREVVRFCERSAPSLREGGPPFPPSFGRGLARSPSGLPAGWVAFHCSGLINYLCCGECPPWLRQPTFVVSLLWA